MKYFAIYILCIFTGLFFGCSAMGGSESEIEETMSNISDALHQRNASGLIPHLSKVSTQQLTEAFDELQKLREHVTKLPLEERQSLEAKLPKSVIAKKPDAFIEDLLGERLRTVTLDEHTESGLAIEAISQESKTEAQVLTRSQQRFVFSLESGVWKIHLFEKALRTLIEETRTANQALELSLERKARRRQIESVLHNALKKNKR